MYKRQVTFALAQAPAGRLADRTGRHREMIAGCLIASGALVAAIALAPLAGVVAAWVLLGVADGAGRPVTGAVIAAGTTAAGRVSAYGWTEGALTAARVAAPFGLAFLVLAKGFAAAFLLVAGVLALAALPVLRVRPVEEAAPAPRPAAGVAP